MLNYKKKKWFLLCPVCEGETKENQGFSHWVWIVFVTPTPNILKMPTLPMSALLHSSDVASFIYASGFLFSNVAFKALIPPWEEEELLRYWRITFFFWLQCGSFHGREFGQTDIGTSLIFCGYILWSQFRFFFLARGTQGNIPWSLILMKSSGSQYQK